MKKRLILACLAAILLLSAVVPMAFATSVLESRHIAEGSCGENLSWSLDGYTLTITGDGAMDDGCPWIEHMDHIERVVLDGGVTKIGKEAFYKFDRLETVEFGDALVEIGVRAFSGCDDLEYIHLPATFRKFGAEAFRNCDNLKFVYCEGPMPRFEDSCLYTGNYIQVFYPGSNPWPSEYTSQLINNFGGRLGISMGTFDETVVQSNLAEEEEETEPAEETEEATEETVAETMVATVPPTEAPTEAPTDAPAAAPTEAPTEVPTEAPTEAPTETTVPVVTEPEETVREEETLDLLTATEPPVEEKIESKSWIGLVLIAGVLTFLLVGALIFRIVSRRGRY